MDYLLLHFKSLPCSLIVIGSFLFTFLDLVDNQQQNSILISKDRSLWASFSHLCLKISIAKAWKIINKSKLFNCIFNDRNIEIWKKKKKKKWLKQWISIANYTKYFRELLPFSFTPSQQYSYIEKSWNRMIYVPFLSILRKHHMIDHSSLSIYICIHFRPSLPHFLDTKYFHLH